MSPAALKLTAKISALEAQLPTLRAELSSTHAQLNQALKPERPQTHPPSQSRSQSQPATHPCDKKKHSDVEIGPEFEIASGIVKRHITLLHQYNEIKDAGLGLMGLIADARGVRLGTVLEEFGVGGKD
jgi:Swi5